MKFTMTTASSIFFWLTSLIWVICHISGALSIETVSSSALPETLINNLKNVNPNEIKEILNNTRRIIYGKEVNGNRPYMVYLKLPMSNTKYNEYKRWLCAGVIVHEEFILTSAACIEDVKHFYVVAGTFRFNFVDDRYNNPCIKNGAKKAVWKCVPRNYVFDGHENDNIRWMNNDIAVVKLEDEYDFTRRVRGCDYAPKPVCYNNQTDHYEQPGTKGSIAGWGSTDKYNDWVNSRRGIFRRADVDQQTLLETSVTILNKQQCKKRWGHRYHNIIDNYMICTADMASELSEVCQEKYVDCTDIVSESAEGYRRSVDPEKLVVHSANHNLSIQPNITDANSTAHFRAVEKSKDGGFCENDHGGPLIYGEGVTSVVIGIISACLVKERTNKCYGPFLYTSIYKNRVLINCAIYKDIGQDCSKMFRGGNTYIEENISWAEHPDGPAKSEIKELRRQKEVIKLEAPVNSTAASKDNVDAPMEHAGLVLRSGVDDDNKKKINVDIVKGGAAVNKTA